MPSPKRPNSDPSLDPQSGLLQAWLEHLERLRVEGLRAGLSECVAAHRVLQHLREAGRLPQDPREQLALLAPVLCSSEEGQERYGALLKAFLESRSDTANRAGHSTHGADGKVQTHRTSPPRPIPWGWILAVAAVVCVLAWTGTEVARVRRNASTASTNPPVVVPPQPVTNRFVAPPPNPEAIHGLIPNTTFRYHTNVLVREVRAERPSDSILRRMLLGLGLLGLVMLLAAWWRRSRRDLFLRQVRTDREIRTQVLGDPGGARTAATGTGLRAVARRLRQRIAGDRRQLDVRQTIRATLQAGGAFSPRFSQVRTTPEYVALIDVRHTFDLNADIAARWVDRLRHLGVSVEAFAFDTSPADGCWRWNPTNPALRTGPGLRPQAVAAQCAGRRLLVFATADTGTEMFTGEPKAWLKPFREIPEKTWFTPTPIESWSGPEASVAGDLEFLLLPAMTESLETLAGWLASGVPVLSLDPRRALGYPTMLRTSPENWVHRPHAPPPEDLKRLLDQLAAYLGPVGFEWLAACAVFPAVSPALTRWLGHRLGIADERRALLEAALASLPFFRHAHLPPWLRQELLSGMTPQTRELTRVAIDECLNRAIPEGGARLLEAGSAAGLLEPVRAWLRQGSGIARDRILLEFLQRGGLTQLAYRLPERVRRVLFRDAQPGLGLQPVWAALGMLATIGLITWHWWVPTQRGAVKEITFTPTNFLTAPAFTNSLGMVFVPVGAGAATATAQGSGNAFVEGVKGGPTPESSGYTSFSSSNSVVWFSAWETRVQDYAAYAAANPKADRSWKDPVFTDVPVTPGPTHPVVNVSWVDATDFCHWLTMEERKAGRLPPGYQYRLPTDREWSAAVGLTGEQGETPKVRGGKFPNVYPWGRAWPPSPGAGNFADETAGRSFGTDWGIITGYVDGYATTSPVGIFPGTPDGVSDLSGNVWEWCEDRSDKDRVRRVLRGGSWNQSSPGYLLSSSRTHDGPDSRVDYVGFRVVLGVDVSAPKDGVPRAAAEPKY